MIGIIDYNVGNIQAVSRSLEELNLKYIIVKNEHDLRRITQAILPGVGSFDAAIGKLLDTNFFDLFNELVINRKITVLGICVGLQLMLERSDEGKSLGLGWIKGNVKKIQTNKSSYKLPHMGWSRISVENNSKLLKNLSQKEFYFLHSYSANPTNNFEATSYCRYGIEIVASLEHDNIFGVQFHPEKSFNQGLSVFSNFARI
tara:strand:- start:2434 stop:3039 length:606 start_codon:yes stop_codon:yes gene_type:complete